MRQWLVQFLIVAMLFAAGKLATAEDIKRDDLVLRLNQIDKISSNLQSYIIRHQDSSNAPKVSIAFTEDLFTKVFNAQREVMPTRQTANLDKGQQDLQLPMFQIMRNKEEKAYIVQVKNTDDAAVLLRAIEVTDEHTRDELYGSKDR